MQAIFPQVKPHFTRGGYKFPFKVNPVLNRAKASVRIDPLKIFNRLNTIFFLK